MYYGNDQASMKILIAAKKLFAKNGFYNTTIYEICKEAGVHVMMLKYNFRLKENVLISLFQVFMPLSLIRINDDKSLVDPVARLKSIVSEVINVQINDPEMILILQHEISLPRPRDEIIQFLVNPLWTELRKILIQGKSKGLFRFDSLDSTMIFITSLILMSRPWEFFLGVIRDPMLSSDLMSEQLCVFILEALKCSAE
ncbi:TetR/AcrR family transcriptional regulator [Cohnella sp. GbtcB17]|uniref:TetR/AcrR family transcriptional regulator n=1 Tax=Cohnella sp. GbtcB17 TaxID=2824762 RepID=UPI001C30302C|nr:helix-turn-helix domain-containing protein [Cohnella sp. GbtcB17]